MSSTLVLLLPFLFQMWEEEEKWASTSPTAFLNKADLLDEWRQTEVGIMKRHSGFKMWMWWHPNGVWWSARVWLMSNCCGLVSC